MISTNRTKILCLRSSIRDRMEKAFGNGDIISLFTRITLTSSALKKLFSRSAYIVMRRTAADYSAERCLCL